MGLLDLSGQAALVTGASRGIGRAVAELLAAHGATVGLVARSAEPLEAVASGIRSRGGEALAWPADVADPAAAGALVDRMVEERGRLDILVNNAGITRDGLLLRMRDEDWNAVMDANLGSVFRFTRAAARPMLKARRGSIVNMASIVGLQGNAGQANYAASKGGIVAFTRSASRELCARGVRVNAVAPGYIETDMTAGMTEEARSRMLGVIPMGRPGKPEDVARAVLFLASDLSLYVTGQVLTVDGGLA
jgi:3-oxoacyl-[acyl-carrier protein] reductase